jgi:hypothetical protein
MLLEESVTLRVEDIGHLHRRPAHAGLALRFSPWPREDHGRRHLQLLQRIRGRVEVPSREVEIDRRVWDIDVAEQQLDGAQIGTRFQWMGRVRVRNVCGVTRLSIPAFRAARRTASQITFVVIGASARQPWWVPGKRKVCGRIQR